MRQMLAEFDAAVESTIGETDGADEANYAVKGMVNVPLSQDKFAVRLVGLQRYDAGYLDNVTLARTARTTSRRPAVACRPCGRRASRRNCRG